MELPFEQATCRGCLATGRLMLNAKRHGAAFKDVTGINISSADGLPQLLCYECSALLQKCARFRSKVIKSHNLLCQYVHENIPFSHEESASPHLNRTRIMFYEVPGPQGEQIEEQTDGYEIINSIVDDNCLPNISNIPNAVIKIESAWSYDENEIILEESDLYVRERSGLVTQERDVEDTGTSEITVIEQVAIKCEQTDRDELLDSCEIIPHCDQKDDKKIVLSRHSDVCDDHLECTLNNVHSSPPKNVQSYFKCDTCNRCFEKKVGLVKHIRVHSANKPCKGDISSKHNISSSKHDQIRTGDKYKCGVCLKCFNYKSDLIQHNMIHAGEKQFRCDVCLKCFISKRYLKKHNKVHTSEKPYICDVCMKCFKQKSYLTEHYRIHTGEKPFKCDVCLKCFISKSDLKKHNRVHTDEKPYVCDVCMKCFKDKGCLTVHYRIHTGEKPFKCDICMKCFSVRSHLIKHNRIHTGERPFKCDVCKKCFITMSHLTQHYRIHTGEKPYKCDVCMKCFNQKSALTAHARIHTGEKPFKCDVCMKYFNCKSNLTKHIQKNHTDKKLFKCDVCMKCFINKGRLIKHNRIHTGEKPLNVCMYEIF